MPANNSKLKDTYCSSREKNTGVLAYLAALRHAEAMVYWQKDSEGEELLAGAVRNVHV